MKKSYRCLLVLIILTIFSIIFVTNKSFAETKNGWVKENKKWYYYDEYGSLERDGKFEIDGKYYWFNMNGVMRPQGWYNNGTSESPKWYYITESGACATGWKKISGIWYYFFPDEEIGLMASNGDEVIDGKTYVFDKSGAMAENGWVKIRGKYSIDDSSNPNNFTWWFYVENQIALTGWQKINKVWYYFERNGLMVNEPTYISSDNKVWFFDSSGKWISNPKQGWVEHDVSHYDGKLIDKQWYYFEGQNGVRDTWKTIEGKEYHFDSLGRLSVSTFVEKDGKKCFVNSSGALVKNLKDGWYPTVTSYGTEIWFYFENGEPVKGWKDIGGKTYYFNENSGWMVHGRDYIKDESGVQKQYGFDDSGALVHNQWIKNEYETTFSDYTEYTTAELYYFDENGVYEEKKNCWAEVDGNRYYFKGNGSIITGETMDIDRKLYLFDNTGKCIMTEGWHSVKREVRTNGVAHTETFWYWIKNDQGEVAEDEWITINGKTYYASVGGAIHTNKLTTVYSSSGPGNGSYAFDSSGALVKNKWFATEGYDGVKIWYYIGEDGKPVTNQWKASGKDWYYLDATGKALQSCTAEIKGKYYSFDKDSKMIAKKGWNSFKDVDGLLVWVYVIDSNGEIKTNSTLKENGKTYNFGTDGIWIN